MAAVISVCQQSGVGYSSTVVAKNEFYFLPIDSNVETSDDWPIPISPTSTVYSYEMWLFFRCDVAPNTKVYNFKIWTSGSLPTGNNITVNTSDIWTYQDPVNTKSTAGTRDNLINYTSSNKLNISGELTKVGDKTAYIVLQLEVSPSASSGTNSQTIYYSYDEI